MKLKEAQKRVDELISELNGYWTLEEMLLALSEEVGELSREVLAFKGLKNPKSSIKEEIGDVLFALICIANGLNVDLAEVLEKTLLKYRGKGKINKPPTHQ